MPDDERTWSLEKKEHRSYKQAENEQAEKVRQCPECFFTFSAENGNKVCPHCGYVFPKRGRKLEEEKKAELIKVEGFRLIYDGPESCSSYLELLNYARTHGYKPGWAYYQARRRGLIA